jgi:hypothetical protein
VAQDRDLHVLRIGSRTENQPDPKPAGRSRNPTYMQPRPPSCQSALRLITRTSAELHPSGCLRQTAALCLRRTAPWRALRYSESALLLPH